MTVPAYAVMDVEGVTQYNWGVVREALQVFAELACSERAMCTH
jgi:hypothetical protein